MILEDDIWGKSSCKAENYVYLDNGYRKAFSLFKVTNHSSQQEIQLKPNCLQVDPKIT